MSHVCVTPIWSRISRQDNNTFYIDWKDQDKRENFKNLQNRDNNYKNIVLSRSHAALQKSLYLTSAMNRSIQQEPSPHSRSGSAARKYVLALGSAGIQEGNRRLQDSRLRARPTKRLLLLTALEFHAKVERACAIAIAEVDDYLHRWREQFIYRPLWIYWVNRERVLIIILSASFFFFFSSCGEVGRNYWSSADV